MDNKPAAPDEQLRRLKNTIMGAGYRLKRLAGSGDLDDSRSRELAALSQELTDVALRLERLLAGLRRNG